MSAIQALILAVLLLAVLGGQRKWALLAMVTGIVYLTQNETVQVGGFNLWPSRFLELAGFIRVLCRREFSFRQMNRIDHALIWLYLYATVVFLLRSKDGQAYQIGVAVDAYMSYFAFRGLLRDMDDLQWFLRVFVVLLAPYALLVLVESHTGHNPFSLLGGAEGDGEWTRKGRPRCFGTFRQPDTLGMFAASFLPLYIGMACNPAMRKRALAAICFALMIVWAANSGGESGAAMMAIGCWLLWRFRTQMRKVRWAILGLIGVLALVMKAPVWFIFDRLGAITGGDGWHRSYLIDVAYRHLDQWWFAGMPITATTGWFPYDLAATGGADITNQYIAFGLAAGAGAIVLFIVLLSRAFSELGKALAAARSHGPKPAEKEFLLWGLGVMLVIHIINWFGITYFDQMYMVWFMELAVISGVSASSRASQPQTEQAADLPGQPQAFQPEGQMQAELLQA